MQRAYYSESECESVFSSDEENEEEIHSSEADMMSEDEEYGDVDGFDSDEIEDPAFSAFVSLAAEMVDHGEMCRLYRQAVRNLGIDEVSRLMAEHGLVGILEEIRAEVDVQ